MEYKIFWVFLGFCGGIYLITNLCLVGGHNIAQ